MVDQAAIGANRAIGMGGGRGAAGSTGAIGAGGPARGGNYTILGPDPSPFGQVPKNVPV